ncbi:hypothetical protein PR202_gb12888 [Eleusine coracana subsp. coracana]|uniref:Uncharacterized protein n=1 Tax=Eleusine coracana subsp. coracana TaxID=191504 RepID=A0AAV5ER68_ELECO|nr:hypothetical protein PR202_gb12888 [Eleusine coracana subsp. coracana]
MDEIPSTLTMKNVLGTTDAMRKNAATGERTTDRTTDEWTVKPPHPKHNRDDRHRRDDQDRCNNEDNDHRHHCHDDNVGPRHGRRATLSPDWHRQSMTPTNDEIDGIKAYIPRLRIARWPKGIKSVPIEKYDGQTNPREWLQLYSMVIQSVGGDSYVMANYLPVRLDPAVRIWLTSLP